jgi:hypothetical protein
LERGFLGWARRCAPVPSQSDVLRHPSAHRRTSPCPPSLVRTWYVLYKVLSIRMFFRTCVSTKWKYEMKYSVRSAGNVESATSCHHGASNQHQTNTHLVSLACSAEGFSRPKTPGQPPPAMTAVSNREVSRVLCCLVPFSKRPAWATGELGRTQWRAPGAFRQSLSSVFSGLRLGTAVAEPGCPGEKDLTTCRGVSKPDNARQVSNKPTRRWEWSIRLLPAELSTFCGW